MSIDREFEFDRFEVDDDPFYEDGFNAGPASSYITDNTKKNKTYAQQTIENMVASKQTGKNVHNYNESYGEYCEWAGDSSVASPKKTNIFQRIFGRQRG